MKRLNDKRPVTKPTPKPDPDNLQMAVGVDHDGTVLLALDQATDTIYMTEDAALKVCQAIQEAIMETKIKDQESMQ